MMIILNMTLMALLQKDIRITCWPSSIALMLMIMTSYKLGKRIAFDVYVIW